MLEQAAPRTERSLKVKRLINLQNDKANYHYYYYHDNSIIIIGIRLYSIKYNISDVNTTFS